MLFPYELKLLNLEHILLWSFIEMKYAGQPEQVKLLMLLTKQWYMLTESPILQLNS